MRSASVESESCLSRGQWLDRRAAHRERVAPWTTDRVRRRSVSIKDPVFDFLFDYYSFRPSHLERWSPGCSVTLRDVAADELPWSEHFAWKGGTAVLVPQAFPEHRRPYLVWALRYLKETGSRAPTFHCFGLHEWAMVYKCEQPRHEQLPLRLPTEEIHRAVEGSDLRCTHFDAFRFFTPAAVPLNRTALTREGTTQFDQRGCLHVNMDLYKFAYKIAPWCPSELVADAFEVALEARRIDMRASPYDLRTHGFEPICIERADGREEYVREQRRIAELARPVREALCAVYETLIDGGRAN